MGWFGGRIECQVVELAIVGVAARVRVHDVHQDLWAASDKLRGNVQLNWPRAAEAACA